MRKKLTDDEVAALLADYDEWNPHSESETRTAADIAAKHGVSKQTMYTYVQQRKRASGDVRQKLDEDDLVKQLAQANEAILFLTGELIAARQQIAALERRLELALAN